MNNEELKKARKEYKYRKENSEKAKLAIEELKRLESDSMVKRYLELKSLIATGTIADDKILAFNSFVNKTTSKDSYKIYVYIGSISWYDEETNNLIFVNECDIDAYFNVYRDLETEENIEVPTSNIDSFEKNNRIVRFGTSNSSINNEKFYELQKKFFLELTHNTPVRTISKTIHLHL